MKAYLAELVRIERLRMHKEDIDGLQAVELVQEYEQAIKEADIAFCDAESGCQLDTVATQG